MAFRNAKGILRNTSGMSALRLLALTAENSRPWLAPLSRAFMRTQTRDGGVPIDLKFNGHSSTMMLRTQDMQSDLHSVIEVVARKVYPLDPGFNADIVIDGGANIGLFTLQAAATFPRAAIVCCEPLPRNAEQLRRHLALNDISAQVAEVCIGGERTTIPFYCRDANASSFDPAEPYERVTQVEVLRLVDLLQGYDPQRILIKLDIEGLEVDTLEQYVPTEQRAVIVLGELHRHVETRPRMEALFREHGWSFVVGDEAGDDVLFEARSPAAQALGLPQQQLH
jgi:FkbM family methyltransferase